MEEDTTVASPIFRPWSDAPRQSPAKSVSTSVFIEDAAILFAEKPIEHVQREESIQQVQRHKQEETSQSAFLQPTDVADPRMSNQGATKKRRAKNQACPYCYKKFDSNYHLRGHIRARHTGERPYQCEYEGCKDAFAIVSALRRHIKIHTQEKPHQCPICEMSFGRKEYLKNHIRRVHGKPA